MFKRQLTLWLRDIDTANALSFLGLYAHLMNAFHLYLFYHVHVRRGRQSSALPFPLRNKLNYIVIIIMKAVLIWILKFVQLKERKNVLQVKRLTVVLVLVIVNRSTLRFIEQILKLSINFIVCLIVQQYHYCLLQPIKVIKRRVVCEVLNLTKTLTQCLNSVYYWFNYLADNCSTANCGC